MVRLSKLLALPLALGVIRSSASPIAESGANTLTDVPDPAPLGEVIDYLQRARASSEERKLGAILRAADDLQAAKAVLGLDSAAAAEESELIERAAQSSHGPNNAIMPRVLPLLSATTIIEMLERLNATSRVEDVANVLRAADDLQAAKAALELDSAPAAVAVPEESQLVERATDLSDDSHHEFRAKVMSLMASIAVMLAGENATSREQGTAAILRATFGDAAPSVEEEQQQQPEDAKGLEKRMEKGSTKHILCCIFTIGVCPGGPRCQV